MGAATMIIVLLPWLDRAQVKSIRQRGVLYKTILAIFIVSFIGLGILGALPPTNIGTILSQIFSVIYFAFFLAMPWYTKIDKTKPVPDRVSM